MIHPIESCCSIRYRAAEEVTEEIRKLDSEFIGATNRLLSENLDFDYGDEELLSRYASADGELFKVGQAQYKAVLIPELKTIRSTTLKLLDAFADQGGKICCLGKAPEYVDAVRSDEAKKVFAKFQPVTRENDTEELSKTARRVSMTGPDGTQVKPLLYRLAETEDAVSLFICNVGIEFSDHYMAECLVRDRKLSFPSVDVTLELPERHLGLATDAAGEALLDRIADAVRSCPDYQGTPPISKYEDFSAAVLAAHSMAQPGDVVILSPACASFDHFKNFAQRGEAFKKIIYEL